MKKHINDKMLRMLCFCVAWLGFGLALQAQTCTLTTQAAAIAQGKEAVLHVTLSGETEISGGQFTLTLPQGISIEEVTLNEERSSGHTLEYRVDGNSVRILFYAQPTAPLRGTEGTLCMLALSAASDMESDEYEVTFSEVRLAMDAITSAEVTAIDGTLTVTARYLVSTDATEGGSVEGGGFFDAGDMVTLTATHEEGYRFEQWSDGSTDNPYTFEAREHVTLTAQFAPNAYEVIYVVDGVEYKRDSVLYGATIVVPEAPAKEGYTFSGWTGVPDTMPAENVTVTGSFVTNGYTLTYVVDGEEYKSILCEYGAAITAEAAPTKEGYTFSGWEGLPETMPANDVTVTGSFTVNWYKITYMVDGAVRHTDSVAYGAAIEAIDTPVKEGYTFSGWTGLPDTMPAEDVIVTGSFVINGYTLTYMVDGKVYKSIVCEYGAAITAEAAPTKEGYTFSGWEGLPETMPANDITVTGSFTVNWYKITYMVDGAVHHTDSVAYGATIAVMDAPVKEGYTFSGWSEIPETMPAEDVTITGRFILNQIQTDDQGLIFELNEANNTFAVSGCSEALSDDLVIPSALYGVPVAEIKDRVFMGAENIRSVVVPASVTVVGKRVFYGCSNLLVVEWNTANPVDAACFDEPDRYGNMLVFVSDEATPVTYEGNVVINGVAEAVVLTDGLPFRNPRVFTAANVSFTRKFSKRTKIGEAGGWEAMVLPFDVEHVESEEKGALLPFGEADFSTSLPYWIATMQTDGTFVNASSINANTPFIMEVPNGDEYEDIYNVEGTVTFSATDVTVHATANSQQPSVNGYSLQASYEGVDAASGIYALNDEEFSADGNTFLPGGVFVADSRDIRPFEAYVYSSQAAPAPYLRIGGEDSTGVEQLYMPHSNAAWYTLQGIRLSGKPQERGVYIHNGRKVIIN